MRITLKEIAELAGVSPSTVSRVINNSKPVNEDIRNRIIKIMKEKNYPFFADEDAPLQKSQPLIGVIGPQYSNTVLEDLIVGVNKVSKLYGFDTVIGLTDNTTENELHYVNLFSKVLGVQGIIFMGNQWNDNYNEIVKGNLTPVVLVGQISSYSSIPSVHVDNITASYEAVTYLINGGHKHIAMIRGLAGETVREHRYIGYQKAIQDSELTIKEEWVVESELTLDGGAKAMAELLNQDQIPTAIFCSTDSLAIGAMNYLVDHGYRVPEDFSVFGFDGIELSSLVRPNLSTIRYSAVEIGMTATRNLIKLCKDEQEYIPPHINVLHHLVIRDSTKTLE